MEESKWRQDHGRYQEDWPKISNAEFVMRETKLWNIFVAGCKVLANSEYLMQHNRALMIMAVNWAKEYELIGNDVIWYK